ncbi:MAG TPA: amino acid adenylation domain-containing protein, partial [Terrimicrobiaceae bacterium]
MKDSTDMEGLSKRIAALSPAKRALLQQKLQQKSSSAEGATLASTGPRGPAPLQKRPQRLPLSYAQQRLWFLDKLEGSSAEYNIREPLRLKGELDCRALERAANALIERHESLRTRIVEEDGEPLQVIDPASPLSLRVEDLRDLNVKEREEAVKAAIWAESQIPFDLCRGPLLRGKLLKLGEREHVLLSTFHHIIFDGWSSGVFLRELGALYDAFCRGVESPLEPLGIQYADYALWQRDQLQNQELERQLAYWKSQLAGAPRLALPTDLPRPARRTYAGASRSILLSPEFCSQLKALSRQEHSTLFMTLLAAFQVLLSRYSGQKDISIGIPAVNRTHIELEGLIGFFLNTLVLRGDLSGDLSFRELLRRVHKTSLDAYAHADVPFEKLVEEMHPERSLSHTPLFGAFLNFLNLEHESVQMAGLEAERCQRDGVKSKFDLTLYVFENEKGLWLTLSYGTELFLPATIERMLRHFQILLEAIVERPRESLRTLPMLAPEERAIRKVTDQCVRPSNPFLRFEQGEIEQSIPARFKKQVEKDPLRVAVKSAKFQWTYRELDRKSNAIAREILCRCGYDEQRIALLLDHDAPMIAAILGVLKAGKAYVPFDPAFPWARLAKMIEDSQANAIIVDEANKAFIEECNTQRIRVIQLAELDDKEAAQAVDLSQANSVAYLLYTSGSTGEPKAVTQIHRNVLHHIRSYTNSLHICAEDRLLLIASYSVDAAVMDIFAALLNGATLSPYDVRRNEPVALMHWMVNEEITVFHSTPTFYRYFAGSLPERQTFPSLRMVVMGGEKVLPSDVELYKRHSNSDCIFVNGFGPSESTLGLQCLLDTSSEYVGNSVPVGNPVEETEVLLLDTEGEPGQVCGEIAIRSAYLVPGYWRRSELTAAAFLPDAEFPSCRIYRTGDFGRLLPNGMIEFLGRRDSQVKIRGYRVEPAEIEVILSTNPKIAHAAVVARQNARGEEDLIAYVVSRPDSSISSRQLRDFAARILPNYMIPQAILILQRMPLTASGKIDRKALP